MKLSLGIVGLPNVGKSTLFNALTSQSVPAENYPFCTIDPNVGIVSVKDERVNKIAEISKPIKIIPAVVEFVDIAGLVKGAASGAGLGNKFLANIREVNAIVHVVRNFKNSDILHVEENIDPLRDIELINTELILKDIETVENRIKAIGSKARFDDKLTKTIELLNELLDYLKSGKLAIDFEFKNNSLTLEDTNLIRMELSLLTDKPVIFLINASDEDKSLENTLITTYTSSSVIFIDVKLEYDLALMEPLERDIFMKEFGLTESGLDRLTRLAYKTLGLISFFTEGKDEVRAWTIRLGDNAVTAASAIHTDISKNFIVAEVCSYLDFIESLGWLNAKNIGKVRLESKSYIMRDGDIVYFKHGG